MLARRGYVIVAKRERAPSNGALREPAARTCVRWYVTTLRPRSAMTLRDLIEREGEDRGPEGIETPPPGKSSERPRSKRREPDLRNVEAEGSSPFTSTKGPGQRVKVGTPRRSQSTVERYVFVVELENASWPHSPKDQVTSRRPDLRHSGMCDWAARAFMCLYGRIDRPVVESSRWVKGPLEWDTELVCESEGAGTTFTVRTSARSISGRQEEPSQDPGRITLRSCPGILAIWPQCVRS